jgi:hypothetical protein
MKNYFNKPDTNVYLIIDNEKNQAIFVNNSTNIKNIIVISDASSTTNYITESTDTTKWVVSDETTVTTIINSIMSSI